MADSLSRGSTFLDGIKSHASTAVWVGVLLMIAGVLALCAPLAAGVSVMVMIGSITILCGAVLSFLAFRMGLTGRGLFTFLVGLLMIVAGGYVFSQPVEALGTMTVLLAAYFLASGITELVSAFGARPGEGWTWMALNGAVTLVLGLMIWQQFPLSGVWAVGTLFGVKLLMSGWSLFAIASAVKRGIGGVQAALR